jgi:hypothetical protein
MKYVAFTAKHHDGFCMFDTRTTDYRVTHADCPFHANGRANIALEVFNARCLLEADNLRAAALAAQHGKAITAGSDARIGIIVVTWRLDSAPYVSLHNWACPHQLDSGHG